MELDATLPGLVVLEERVQLGNVHYHSIPLIQDIFQMVLITLVLGKIYKHLQGGKEEEEGIRLNLN